ncbi:conserved hypothetical protein [Rhodococcus jostii RHA1]|uniref:Mce-associated membrane protein n=1 Tax=Rhodococcus jostii (strain RHA1) TaxID=101510 RepID=Q0SD36_RHOJR|nr:hypothetical protein [Rhodococcus jostii]ABG94550.1 conserved hypothetical protein [Rhodococcus jostii RHA1]
MSTSVQEQSVPPAPESAANTSRSRRAFSLPGSIARRLTGLSNTKLRVLITAVAVLTVTAVATGAVLVVQLHNQDRARTASAEATAAAREKIPAVLSYEFGSLDDEFSSATTNLTGPFRDDFAELARTVIVPAARADSIVTKAEVVESSVVDATSDKVTVLMFLNQNTTSTKLQAPRLDGSRVTVEMTPIAGDWLISGITPV